MDFDLSVIVKARENGYRWRRSISSIFCVSVSIDLQAR